MCDRAHGLFAHGALVGVARTLVVMRIGDESGADAEQRERLDFHVRRRRVDVCLVDGDVAVVLFVHVQILDQAVAQKVLERAVTLRQLFHVHLLETRPAVLDDHVRPTKIGQSVLTHNTKFKWKIHS